jgi:N-acetylmuramoyl-L-alanine amidase
MRWSSGSSDTYPSTVPSKVSPPVARPFRLRVFTALLLFVALLAFVLTIFTSNFLHSAPADDKRLSIYSATANYTIAVTERNGRDYVSLLEILKPLGAVNVKTDGLHWKLRYKDVASEFTNGKTRARIQGRDFDLPASFLLEAGRGLVPLGSLSTLVPQFLPTVITFRESSRRLFIGNVAVHFTAQISRTTPPTLVMNFTSPVNPMIATEPGKLRMVFSHEALVPPGSQALTFDSNAIPSASFEENNGIAQVVVNANAPLFAGFSNDGHTISIATAPQSANQASSQPQSSPTSALPVANSPPQPANPPTAAVSAPTNPYFAVVDASHGGDERGAALTDQLAEKDVTLAFARRLRQELVAHGINTLVVRDGDVTLSLDQRASLTNVAHPKIYICVHAASQGTGVRLYTALLPEGAGDRGPFLDWDTAQSAFRFASQSAEASLSAEFGSRLVPVRILVAPLRPLNNIAAAAVAIEVAPPVGGISELTSPAYQQVVAEAVAAGITSVRDKLGTPR